MMDIDHMLETIRHGYGLEATEVLTAMRAVPRERFVPSRYWHRAYGDCAVPIGFGQTVSQPYTVAFMSCLSIDKVRPCQKVLEIGTGSGYQAAVLSKLFKKVYTVEIIPELAQRARNILQKLGYKNITVITGQGGLGYPKEAPFDAIIITAAVKKVPRNLFKQLKTQGILVAPVGKGENAIMRQYIKTENRRLKVKNYGTFTFVPFV